MDGSGGELVQTEEKDKREEQAQMELEENGHIRVDMDEGEK